MHCLSPRGVIAAEPITDGIYGPEDPPVVVVYKATATGKSEFPIGVITQHFNAPSPRGESWEEAHACRACEERARRVDFGPDLEREDWQTAAAALCFLFVALLAAFAQLIGWVRA